MEKDKKFLKKVNLYRIYTLFLLKCEFTFKIEEMLLYFHFMLKYYLRTFVSFGVCLGVYICIFIPSYAACKRGHILRATEIQNQIIVCDTLILM